MLKRTFTAVVERNVLVQERLETEPYETGWASQIRCFVHALDASPDTSLTVAAEVSPEGLTWCPHEAAPVERKGPGLVSLPLTQVGPWLRLAITAKGGDRPPKVLVYLCLTE